MLINRAYIRQFYLSMVWLYSEYSPFKRDLKRYFSYKDIGIYKLLSWHNSTQYFIASTISGKFFIKTDFSFGLLKNEIICDKLMKKHSLLSSRGLFLHSWDAENYNYVIYPFVKHQALGEFLMSPLFSDLEKKKVVAQIEWYLDVLYNLGIVYRDIKADNFFVTDEKVLVLFDFSFAISNDANVGLIEIKNIIKNRDVLLGMGRYSQYEKYKWDDAYGMVNLLIGLEKSTGLTFSEEISSIERKIGRLTYNLEDIL